MVKLDLFKLKKPKKKSRMIKTVFGRGVKRKSLSFLVIVFLVLQILSFMFFFFSKTPEAMAWWDGSWNYRKKLTFDNSGQAENLANFPVLVKLTSANFDFSKAQSNGEDIRFVDDDDSTALDYEIELWDSEGETAYIWVEVPQIDASSNTDYIYMYYGNLGASDNQNITGTWNSDFKSVYHFAQTSGNYNDSSAAANHCTSVSVNSRTATGQIYYAPDFEASNSSHRIGCGNIYSLGDVTQEAWINLESSGIRPITQHAASGETEDVNITFGLELDSSDNLWQQWEYGAGTNQSNTSTANVSTGSLTYAAAVRDTANDQVIWYINGVASGSATSYVNEATGGASGALYIGGRISSAQWFDGIIDELRISHTLRSAYWIKASYLSETDAFITFGDEEGAPAANPTISSAANQTFAVNDSTTAISAITITDDDSTPTITAANDIRIKIPAGFNMTWDETDTTAVIGGGASTKTSATVSYEDSNKTLVIDVTSNFSASDSITVSGLSFKSFPAASASDNLDLEVNNDDSTQATDDKTIAIGAPTISSAANQTFAVSDSATAISTITITDDASNPVITAGNDIRIKIPAGFNMAWDETYATATIGGGALSKASTAVTYEDSNATLVINVTTNFSAGDSITVSDLFFKSFTNTSGADNLELEINNADTTTDEDDKTITIVNPTITINTSLSQLSSLNLNSSDNVLGVVSIVRNAGTGSVNALTIKENGGTIDASANMENIEVWLSSDTSLDGGDNQLGSTGSFDGVDGEATFTEGFNVTTTTQYLIIVGDIRVSASDGDTIEIQVKTVTSADSISGSPLDITGTTTVSPYWWNSSWNYRKQLIFDNSDQDENLTDFPVLVKLTSANFDFTKAQSAGQDLRFIDIDNSSQLNHEIEYYDPDGQTAVVWVKIPQIDASSDTDYIFMYYGNDGASDGQNVANVWSNNFAAVYHFAEQSGDYLDSTSNNNDSISVDLDYGPNSGWNNTDANGFGYYPRFTSNGEAGVPSTEGDCIGVGSSDSLNFGTSAFTIFLRLKSSLTNHDSDITRKGSTGVAENSWWKVEWGDDNLDNRLHFLIRVSGSDKDLNYDTLAADGNWHNTWHVRSTADTKLKMYLDGSLILDGTGDNGSVSSSADVGIGCKDTLDDDFYDGNVDEVRYITAERSADWIAAEELSFNSTFITFGSEIQGLPIAPSGASAVRDSDTQFTITWTDNSSNETGFKVERKTDGGDWAQIDTDTTSPYVDTTTSANHSYQYRVRAYNPVGNSDYSTDSDEYYTTPAAPTIGTPTVDSSTAITWTWTDNSNYEDSFRLDFATGSGTDVNDIAADSTSYQTTGLTPNTEYAVYIHSYRTDRGESLASSDSDAVYTLANVPSSLSLSVNSATQITASWSANSNPEGTEYYVENTTAGTNSGWITSTSWASTSLSANTTYNFRVKARNGDGTETDYTTQTSGRTENAGGLGLPLTAFNPPAPPSTSAENPQGGFKILINQGDSYTTSREVSLRLFAGSDTERMAISNTPEFGENTGQIPFQDFYIWDLCYRKKDCPEGEYIVYIKFFTKYGIASQLLSANIILREKKPATEEIKEISKKVVEKIKEIPEKIIEIIKPKPEEETKPVEEVVKKEAPLSLKGQWQLLSSKPIEEFVFSPLPKEISILATKFPKLKETFEKIGIAKISDIEKLKEIKFSLPGLTERLGLPTSRLEPGKLALPKGIPVVELSPELKEEIPTEIVFAKTGGGLIDFNINLTVTEEGKPEQKISTVSAKPLQLVVKPEEPVKSIKGYVIFKRKISGKSSFELPLEIFTASLIFANPTLAQAQEKPVRAEEELVLLEFGYIDLDGDGIYTAKIQSPVVEGEYEIITVMDYEDLGRKEIRLTTIVDPEGYIYDKDGDREIRIPGAIVSLFCLNPETKQYQLWPAEEYQQENPQITDVTGKYSFLVPEGSYYLKVEAPGYLVYEGKSFQVTEGRGIHTNIELKTKYWLFKVFDWKTIVLILVVILLLYNFYRDRIKENH